MGYTHVHSEPNLWTVGFFDQAGKWIAVSDHESEQEATERVAYLNGGGALPAPSDSLSTVEIATIAASLFPWVVSMHTNADGYLAAPMEVVRSDAVYHAVTLIAKAAEVGPKAIANLEAVLEAERKAEEESSS